MVPSWMFLSEGVPHPAVLAPGTEGRAGTRPEGGGLNVGWGVAYQFQKGLHIPAVICQVNFKGFPPGCKSRSSLGVFEAIVMFETIKGKSDILTLLHSICSNLVQEL